MEGLPAALDVLSPAWWAAIDEAWVSWRAGNYGVGAVLVDPVTGELVARGRNLVGRALDAPRQLSGNMVAHAEMNAFAALDRFDAAGLHLYTTLEPCVMCSATTMLMRVEHVHFGSADEFYDGLADVWHAHPLTSRRMPAANGPFTGDLAPLAAFCRLLPLSFTTRWFGGRTAARRATERHPDLVALARRLDVDAELRAATATDDVRSALAGLWRHLPAR